MTDENRFKITSNDYVDLIIDYNQNTKIFDRFPDGYVHIMNDIFAIIYEPKEMIEVGIIRRDGYTFLPACYGLTSQGNFDATGIAKLRRLPNFNLRGQGVLVGIIDTGIDYTNNVFRNKDGTTRIVSIWDQSIESENRPLPYNYGTQYNREDINRALGSSNPIEVVPSVDINGHGTMLAGIAAGSEVVENDFSGVVPDCELVIVKLKQAKESVRQIFAIPNNVDCFQENDIMWGVQYCVDKARSLQRPIAICIGLGSSQGSHDGRGALSYFISVVSNYSGVVISVAAGNEGDAKRHFYDEIEAEIGYSTVQLNVGEGENGFSMELWGTSPNSYSIDIMSPSNEYIPRIPEGIRVNREISFIFEKTTISIDYQMIESSTGDELILMRFRNPASGVWNFKVYTRGDLQGSFHIWLPSGNFITNETYFLQADPYTTITSPGNSPVPITCTAYNSRTNSLYRKAGKGYTRINEIKPDIAAPGVDVLGPTLQKGFSNFSGTSVATAYTSGVNAMILEWAIVKGNYPGVDAVEIKKFIIRGAERNPQILYPNRDWGYGILNVYNVFDTLRGR